MDIHPISFFVKKDDKIRSDAIDKDSLYRDLIMSDGTKTNRTAPKMVYEGYAAEDIEKDSIVLKVICPELMPHSAIGTVGAGITTGVTKLTNRDGVAISSPVTTANHIVATWEGESGMRYPAQVRKGEPVEVYKIANQDKYYWRTTGRGRDFRKTDRMAFEIAAQDPNKPGTEKSDENTYSAYLDSDAKKAGIRTSKANGEAVAMKAEFDLENGTFTVSDDSESPGNRVFLDSGAKTGNPIFQVNLSTGTVIKFENKNGMISIPEKLLIKAGERIVFDSPITIFNLAQSGAFIINAANVAINGAKDIIFTTSVFGVIAASSKFAGVLIAAAARLANAVKASAGGNYTPTSVSRPQESPVNVTSNTPDTSMTGPPYQS